MESKWAAILRRAEEAVRRLERIRRECGTVAAYQADADLRSIAERNIEIAVEAIIDLANHLIGQKSWPRPANAPLAIEILIQQKALSPRLGRSLISWIKTRNVIVHLYAKIDNTRVYRTLRLHLPSIRQGISILSRAAGQIR